MQEIVKALVKARSQFKDIKKDRTNPHYKSRYATLDSVLEAVKPGLDAAELAIVQAVEIREERTVLVTHLLHSSGESIQSVYPLPEGLTDPQKLGSAITYARRYALCGILSVTADEDDDGNANAGTEQSKTTNFQQRSGGNTISEKQITRLTAIAKQAGYSDNGLKALVYHYGFTSRSLITKDVYEEICGVCGNTELAPQWNEYGDKRLAEQQTAAS